MSCSRSKQALLQIRRMFNFLPLGGLEVKWVVVGGVALAAAVAAGRKDKAQEQSFEQAQQQQAAQQQQPSSQEPCPQLC